MFLLRSIEGVAFLTRDIGNYPCLTEASTADHYSTTCLQYSVVKIFKNLYKLVVRRLQVHEIHPAYELTQLYLLDGPLSGQLQSKHFGVLGCPGDFGKGWRGDLGTFMISRPI